MKNAFVLVAHTGDRGMQQDGDIMLDLSNDRFEALEKIDLVREATADEVKNWKPAFKAEAEGEKPAGTVLVAIADLHALREHADTLGNDLRAAEEGRNKLETDIGNLRETNESLSSQLSTKDGQIAALTAERDEALAASSSGGGSGTADTSTPDGSAKGDAAGEKDAEQPQNGDAPAPSNKAAARASTKA